VSPAAWDPAIACQFSPNFGNYGQEFGVHSSRFAPFCAELRRTGLGRGAIGIHLPRSHRPVLSVRTHHLRSLASLLAICAVGCQRCSSLDAGSSSRCPDGLVAVGPRCCAPGQSLSEGHCVGKPLRCPDGWISADRSGAGCVWISRAVFVPPGRYLVGPNDWESEQVVTAEGQVPEFWLDATEVTNFRWHLCAAAGRCKRRAADSTAELGQPVVSVTAPEAESFCAWAGGRLPRSAEWLRVAAGPSSRRFPWGQTGLVCRRSSFGLVRGPCAEGGSSPDWAAARPDGKSELGLFDLVGNVAEIVKAAEGTLEVRGGSFRADHAAALKSWAMLPYAGAEPDVGFRCAYDADPAGVPR
jgi:formylglycine-generating enzyme